MSLPSDRLPSDHINDADAADVEELTVSGGRLGPIGWVRWFWRQLTSMRTALFLLLLLALAAVPGSLVPQHISDPNGVVQYQSEHPTLYPILDKLQVFDTYSSVWFSAIYILLFVSLIGCVIPRVKHHVQAMLAKPPRTPFRLNRMAGYQSHRAAAGISGQEAVARARGLLKAAGYRTVVFDDEPGEVSVSGERGYLRETGNLVFHIALLGILVVAGIGGSFGYTGQKIVPDGSTFVNTLTSYDSFDPGRWVSDGQNLTPYKVKVNKLTVKYDTDKSDLGAPLDYTAYVTATNAKGKSKDTTIKVNHPLLIGGSNVYLLGNGYAPVLTFRNATGKVVFQDATPFLPQDANMTSQGIIKIPDGLKKQLGIVGIFMPTAPKDNGAMPVSSYPGTRNPRISLTVYSGNLGLDNGQAVSVYALDPSHLTQIAGPKAKTPGINLGVGETERLPDGLGTVTFSEVKRYASLDIHHDPTQLWMLAFAVLVLAGLLTSLFVPRRRMWVKARTDAAGAVSLEYAGLARGEDPRLLEAVEALVAKHQALVGAADDEQSGDENPSQLIDSKA